MARKHKYETRTTWTGDRGQGTADYRSYDRTLETTCPERPAIPGSSDPAFRGDADRWNPELLLVAALSQCHMLSYLHRCAVGGVVVTGYEAAMVETAQALHGEAAALCFIAASVNFPVRHEPQAVVG